MDIAFIGTSAPIDPIWQKLDNDLGNLSSEGLSFQVERVPLRDYTMLRFTVDELATNKLPKDISVLSKQYIASALADIIVDQLEPKIVWHIVKKEYGYFRPKELSKMFSVATRLLEQSTRTGSYTNTYKTMRRNRILYRLLEYFEDNDTIILEGFINFRLRSYLDELQDTVEDAAKELLVEKEQQEFIKLLQYFVEVQLSKEDLVHVVFTEDGNFDLQNKSNLSIKADHIDDLLFDLVGRTITFDDILVSALISIAPKQIVIHQVHIEGRQEVVETITGVFEDKVKMCTSCDLCSRK